MPTTPPKLKHHDFYFTALPCLRSPVEAEEQRSYRESKPLSPRDQSSTSGRSDTLAVCSVIRSVSSDTARTAHRQQQQ